VDSDMDSLRDSNEKIRICADVESLPFPDGTFDLVTSNMVFEHLDNPLAVLREANRILGYGGVLLIHTASSLHYELLIGRFLSSILPRKTYVGLVSHFTGRKAEDIFPTRYLANTRSKLSRAASTAGFIAGLVAHLETPLSGPVRMRRIQERIRKVLPSSFKGTILAVYIKSQWV
jgi:ubiquinone/menaquinone biosynthesis C-methylase UbiE